MKHAYAYHTKWCDKWNCEVLIPNYGVISTHTMSLSHHLVWYAWTLHFLQCACMQVQLLPYS